MLNNPTYYWQVSFHNAGGSSTWSAIWSFTTVPAIADVPTLSAPLDLSTDVALNETLSWNAADGADTYSLEIATDNTFTNVVDTQTGLTGTTATPANLANNTTYYWRVLAHNSVGDSPWSTSWSFTTSAPAPTGTLVAHWKMDEGSGSTLVDASDYSNNATTSGNPTWVSGVDGGALRFNGSNQFGFAADANSLDLTQSLTIAAWIRPEKRDTQYLIKKAEHNATNGYELSLSSGGKVFFRFNQDSSGNTYRLDSQSSYPTDGTTWMHVAITYDGSVMRMYIDGVQNSTKSFSSASSINTNALTVAIGAGNDGFRGIQGAMDDVRIYNTALSASEISALATITSTPTLAEVPVLSAPANGAANTATAPTLSWNASNGAETYRVQVSAAANFSNPVYDQSNITQLSTTLSGLSNSTVYYWRVLAHNSVGDSNWSSARSFTTTSGEPSLASVPIQSSPSNGAVNTSTTPTISWNASTGADSYRVQVSSGSNFSNLLMDQANITNTSVAVSSLTNSTTYYWRVLAHNSVGDSPWSTSWSFTTSAPAPTGTLVAHWKMDEGSGSTLVDASDYSNNATTSGNPTWVSGVDGGALRFNGSNQFGFAADANSLDLTQSLTIAAWIRPEKRDTQYLIKKAEHNATNGYELSLSSGGKVFFRFNQDSSGNTYRLDSQSSYPTDGTTWMHVAITYDGSVMRMYIDGVQNNTKSFSSASSINTNALTVAIGAGNDGFRGIQGAMDDVRIYNTALSASEISALATITSTPTLAEVPVLSAPANGAANIATAPTLSWNASNGAETYRVQVSAAANFSNPVYDQSNITQLSTTLSGLSNSTVYYWRVLAHNSVGDSNWSSARSFTTTSGEPSLASVPF